MPKSLNDITDMKEVEELAAVYFTPKEIATIIEVPFAEVEAALCEEGSLFYLAFHKGRLQSEYDLRKSIVKLAKSGSSPAQTMAMDLLQKSKLKMIS